jgi:hypothetical protein
MTRAEVDKALGEQPWSSFGGADWCVYHASYRSERLLVVYRDDWVRTVFSTG